ncbi:zinc-finger domain-containing protein [Legionella erythra]|uniref:Zinc-finger domain protein n=1 Tax=Legionella erythra TaxID=448 RepID=A0A0W0TUI7_LEGER|nr:zinc-finger domain-containing protein [Legionella erythra]KTC99142.1 Zinc-finger domain protein [Legionella erythra]
MSENEKKQPACTEKMYVVHPGDLPLSCPTDEMQLWNAHPKVYLPIDKTGQEVCPYCGSRFILQDD